MDHIGKYRIVRELGSGGFATVYLAQEPKLTVPVAIKVFRRRAGQGGAAVSGDDDSQFKQRFFDEARILRQLAANAYIVDMFDFDEVVIDGQPVPYYIMPYLAQNLTDVIGRDVDKGQRLEDLAVDARPRRLPQPQSLLLLQQLLKGLTAVHRAGLVHQDIKPANLLLNEAGDLQLADFGIAKLPGERGGREPLSIGTGPYMSPEQRQGQHLVEPSSDIYAFGVLAYRLLTGALPGESPSPISDYLPDINPQIAQLIAQCLNVDKHLRPADAGVLLPRFNALFDSQQGGDFNTDTDISPASAPLARSLGPMQQLIATQLRERGRLSDGARAQLSVMAETLQPAVEQPQQLIEQLIARVEQELHRELQPLRDWLARRDAVFSQYGAAVPSQPLAELLGAGAALGLEQSQMERLLGHRGIRLAPCGRWRARLRSGQLVVVSTALMGAVALLLLLLWLAPGALSPGGSETAPSLSQVEGAPGPPSPLSLSQRQSIRRYLTWLGFEPGSGDALDAAMLGAIAAFRQAHQLDVHQPVTQRLISQLKGVYDSLEQRAWARAVQLDTAAGYDAYLRAFPQGAHIDRAHALQRTAVELAQQGALQQLATDTETELQRIGYLSLARASAGQQAGRRAIKRAQSDHQLPVTGAPDQRLLTALKANDGQLPFQHFALYNSGVAVDNRSGLMWMRCAVGQAWQPEHHRCQASPRHYRKSELPLAIDHFAGYRDWRLPSIDELHSLYDRSQPGGLETLVFPDSQPLSPRFGRFHSRGGGYFDFETGRSGISVNVPGGYRVRLVRRAEATPPG